MSNPAIHAPTMDNMIQAMTGLNTSPIAPRIVTVNNETQSEEAVGDYKPTTDERVFSDFTTDGSEKDYRQEALLQVSGSPLAYKENQEKKQADIDNLRDIADQVNDDLQEAQKERMERALRENFGYDPTTGMHKMNGIEFSDEALDDHLKRASKDPAQYAKDENITEDEAVLQIAILHDIDRAREIGTPEAYAEVYNKYPQDSMDSVLDKLNSDSKMKNDHANDMDVKNQDVKALY